MSKIITPGVWGKGTHTCPYCGCVYEYDNTDIIYDYGLTGQIPYVLCPYCGNRNNVGYIPVNPTPYPFITTPLYDYNKGPICQETMKGECQCQSKL